MAKIKFEVVTERKIIEVVPGYFRGSADRVEVDVCVKCAAVVFDAPTHDDWHRRNERRNTEHPDGSRDA